MKLSGPEVLYMRNFIIINLIYLTYTGLFRFSYSSFGNFLTKIKHALSRRGRGKRRQLKTPIFL